jgi:RNA polymerase sigma-70 factor, ECF subfamily
MSGTIDNMVLSFPQEMAAEESFQALVERRGRFVFQVAYAAVGRSHDAEDVVQEVFLRLFRTGAWRRVEEEAAFLARMTWRLARARQKRVRTHEDETEILDIPARMPSPEQTAMRQQQEELLRKLVDQLPVDLRHSLVLSVIEEMPSAVVAEMLGIPAGTVRNRVLRARQLLRVKYMAVTGGKP